MSESENDRLQSLVQIAERAKELTNAETVVVALAEDDGQQVYYATGTGKHIDRLQNRRAPAATSGLCGTTFQAGEPVLVCQTAGDNRVRQDHAKALGIDTALAVPIYQEGRLLGAIMVLNREDGSLFDQQSERILNEYSQEAAPIVAEYLASVAVAIGTETI